jgi:hypothetical protein
MEFSIVKLLDKVLTEKVILPYSVLTSDIKDIRDGDFVEIRYYYKNVWIVLGCQHTYYRSVKNVKEATEKMGLNAYKAWKNLGAYPDEMFLKVVYEQLEEYTAHLEKKVGKGKPSTDEVFEPFAKLVCILQYYFKFPIDKKNGVWFNVMRTREQIDSLIAIDEVEKAKKQAKRQRKKEEKQKQEAKKRLFVRIKSPQAGRPCRQYNQVVKSWEEDVKPSFYEAIGWFDM